MVEEIADLSWRWNRAVRLHTPTVAELAREVGGRISPIFPTVPNFRYLDGNLMLKVSPGADALASEAVLSISIVMHADFFKGAVVETSDLPSFQLLQRSVPCSAQEMLDHLLRVDGGNVSAATEADRWTIYYGKALSLLFLPARGVTGDPRLSRLGLVEYFYSMPYGGALPCDIRPC